MPVALVFLTPQRTQPLALLLSGRAIEIGRHKTCTVRLAEPTVGMRHLTLRRRGQAYVMSDEGSQNGTIVLGQDDSEPVLLGPDAPRIVQDRDRVHLGHVAIELRTEEPFFEEGEVELLSSPGVVPLESVRAALRNLGVDLSETELGAAVEALLSAPEESLGRSSRPEGDARQERAPALVDDAVLRDPTPLDWIISLCALGLLSAAGAALYQLITRS